MREHIEKRYALEYVNGAQFMGRWGGCWTRTRDIENAALYKTHDEAEQARQVLRQEAADRLAKSKEQWPDQLWWDIYGGCVSIIEIETITRVAKSEAVEDANSL